MFANIGRDNRKTIKAQNHETFFVSNVIDTARYSEFQVAIAFYIC